VARCPAAAPCRNHTVPKRVGKTTLEERRPRLERPLCAAIEPRFQTQTDTLAEVRKIPRALMRNTTITRLPRSIATGFPSAKRGRCVHERDRWFKSVSLRQRVRLSGVPRTLSAKVAEGRRGRVREDVHVEMSTRLHSPGPRSLC